MAPRGVRSGGPRLAEALAKAEARTLPTIDETSVNVRRHYQDQALVASRFSVTFQRAFLPNDEPLGLSR